MQKEQADEYKLFDRKFVLKVLKKLNQCPKCQNSYSCNSSKRNPDYVKFKFPFLLPCGHNICQNCAFSQRENLICNICNKRVEFKQSQALPSAAVRNTQSKTYMPLRDLLSFNFYLYGQSNFLETLKLDESRNVPLRSSALANGQSNGDVTSRLCFLCKRVTADGMCDTCNEYLCQKCWREHRMDRTDKNKPRTMMDTHSLTRISIDKLKDMQMQCSRHERPADCYCRKCNMVCCLSCARHNHDKHGWKTLLCENQSVHNEVQPMLERVTITRKNMEKSLKDLDALEQQLECHGEETLKQIYNYFTELHSFIQTQQQHIIDLYQTRCEQPQTAIEDARFQLSQALKVLNLMHSNLLPFKDAPPLNTNLRRILDLYQKELNDIPFKVEVSDIPENPFVPQGNLMNDFEKYIHFGYNDPRIHIAFNPIYSSPGLLRKRTADMAPHTKSPLAYTFLNRPEEEAALTSMVSSSTSTSNHKYRSKSSPGAANSAHPPPSKSHEYSSNKKRTVPPQTKTKSSPNLPVQVDDRSYSDVGAFVRYIKSPSEFFINMDSDIREINEFTVLLSRPERDNEPADEVLEGQLYLVYVDNDSRIHRAMLYKLLPFDLCRVNLVDIGMLVQVHRRRLCKIDKEFAKVPFCAVKCSFYDIGPVSGDTWPDESTQLLKEIIANKPVRVAIIQTVNSTLHVEVMTTQYNEPVSVRDALLYCGLAKLRSNNTAFQYPKRKAIAPESQRIEPNTNYAIAEQVSVKVVHVENPYEFYVIRCDQLNEYKMLLHDMNSIYAHSEQRPPNLLMAYPKMCCAVCIESSWQRGRIVEIYQNGNARVLLVDTGVQHVVHWRQIFELHQSVRQTEFATLCMLDGIEPFQENNYTWTKDAIVCFREITSNPILQMEICQNTGSGELKVAMHVMKKNSEGNLDINVASLMVEWGHGLATSWINGQAVTKIEKKRQGSLNYVFSQVSPIDTNAIDANNVLRKDKKNGIQRTPISIKHIVDPGEFYIQLDRLLSGIGKFHTQIQEQNKRLVMQSPRDSETIWSVGDHCFVFTKWCSTVENETADVYDEFHRGIITAIGHEKDVVYAVFLRDVGATVKSIRNDQLSPIDEHFDRVSDAVYRCHLACVEPTGGANVPWARSSVDEFKDYVRESAKSLSATLQGKPAAEEGKSLPIILWSSRVECHDPLAPCITKFTNINNALVNMGLVHLVRPFTMPTVMNDFFENQRNDNEVTLLEWFKTFDHDFRKVFENRPNNGSVTADEDGFLVNGDKDPNLSTEVTTPTKPAPTAWLRCKGIEKTIFAAIPTYIDYDFVVFLHDAIDVSALEQMHTKIMDFYTNCPPLESQNIHYGVGQACLIRYHLDGKYYRGIVTEINEDGNEMEVHFIDYGNAETVTAEELLPYAPFSSLPAFAHKYVVEGISPKNGDQRFHTSVLDIVHKMIVTQQVSVRVPAKEMLKPIKRCFMRLGQTDITEFLVENGYADPTSSYPNNRTYKQHCYLKEQQEVLLVLDAVNKPQRPADVTATEAIDNIACAMESTSPDSETDLKEDNFKMPLPFRKGNIGMAKKRSDMLESVNERLENYLKTTQRGDIAEKPNTRCLLFELEEYKQFHDDYILKRSGLSSKDEFDGTLKYNRWNDCNVAAQDNNDELKQGLQRNYWQRKDDELSDMDDEEFGVKKDKEEENKLDTTVSVVSDFEHFKPNDTSSVISHKVTCVDIPFKWPNLPKNIVKFECNVVTLVSPTLLYVEPHIRDYDERLDLLKIRIENLITNAPLLQDFRRGTKCLARYTVDKEWYRAVIGSHNPTTGQAFVYYVDYVSEELLPVAFLRKCPIELMKIPLCTYKMRLHGITPNTQIYDELIICNKISELLTKPNIWAVVRKSLKPIDNITEIELYEERDSKTPIYEELIQQNYYKRI